MKRCLIFLLSLIFILILLNPMVFSTKIHFWELERTTEIEIIVFSENHAIFLEKMEIKNNFNDSTEINTWFPITWPYLVNKTEYSIYPYEEWNLVKSSNVEYVNASLIELQYAQIGITLPSNYLKSIETYPEIPGILFTGTLEKGKKTGFATRTEEPSGLIERKNGKFLLYTAGITEGQVNSITVKIPHKLRKFLFFDAKLEISNVIPSFAIEPYDPEYKIYRWEEDFLSGYAEELDRNLTMNNIEIEYSYAIPIIEVITGCLIFVIATLVSIFLGMLLQKWIDKKTKKQDKQIENKSKNQRKKRQ